MRISVVVGVVGYALASNAAIVSQIADGQLQAPVTTTSSATTSTPTVDLGYAIHQASLVLSNQSNAYYNFSNIRYAAPPIGDRRWAPPAPPLVNRSIIQSGLYGKICPQAFAGWQIGNASLAGGAENESEDCLFLDVVVPKNVTERMDKKVLVPVMVWIHGGGYTLGSKYAAGSPTGLLDQAGGGEIWVGINYRLGAFGFLNGPNFAQQGTPNVGLYDQRAALVWIQNNIHLFGGSPYNVTVIGESAGGGSIMHQITAFSGVPPPFRRAIIQSPAFIPTPLVNQSNTSYQKFLTAANVSSLAALRTLNTSILQAANKIAQSPAFFGTFTFGPAPDGFFVPDLPGRQLALGAFDASIEVMAGHNTNEAGRYTPPTTSTSADFTSTILTYFPRIPASNLSYIQDTLYPAIYDGTYGYTTPFYRLNRALSEFTFDCNTLYLASAFGNRTYNYLFSVPPGNHTQDVPYTYYGGGVGSVANVTLAKEMQASFTEFVGGRGAWSRYGAEGYVRNFNISTIGSVREADLTRLRCAYWQGAGYGDDWPR